MLLEISNALHFVIFATKLAASLLHQTRPATAQT